jgi:hypothetical protein
MCINVGYSDDIGTRTDNKICKVRYDRIYYIYYTYYCIPVARMTDPMLVYRILALMWTCILIIFGSLCLVLLCDSYIVVLIICYLQSMIRTVHHYTVVIPVETFCISRFQRRCFLKRIYGVDSKFYHIRIYLNVNQRNSVMFIMTTI